MCGLAGFYTSAPRFDHQDIKRMTDAQEHRGPDADGHFISADGLVGLGHRRLSILDLSESANQPMFSHNGDLVMIFNGEIYNYKEIASDLGGDFNTTGDSEVILEAFHRWGIDFLQRLNGMFVIMIYDKRDQTLWIARDRMGIKPLYYYEKDGDLAFASEIKGIRALGDQLDIRIDEQALSQFLHLAYIPAPRSVWRNIKKLPAASFMKVNVDGFTIKSYWSLKDQIQPKTYDDEDEALSKLRELVYSSVQYRMISDVPLGVFLSGGIDSSLVSAVAQQISSDPIKTFSIGFKDWANDESQHAKEVAGYLGTDHHQFFVSEKEVMDEMEHIIHTYDEPFADSSSVPTMLVSKLAREQVTVTLSGDGGDESFMGYGFYNWAERLDHPLMKIGRGVFKNLLGIGPSRFKRVSRLLDYDRHTDLRSHIYSQELYAFAIDELARIQTWGAEKFEWVAENGLERKLSAAEKQAYFDMHHYLPDDLLVKVDRASMRFSLEDRVPLLDHRIIAFALNVDQDLKLRGGQMKYLLKQLLYQHIPASYFDRPKWGFGMPLNKWLAGDLSYLIDEYLAREKVDRYGLIRSAEVQSLVSRFRAGEEYLYFRLWLLIILHRWLDKFA